MSTVLSEKNGQIARKTHRCILCGERINIGESKDVRKGVSYGEMWTMQMHPECHAYELASEIDEYWYQDCSDPAFSRADAIAAMEASK